MNQIIVNKGRTNVVRVSLGMDVSSDTITSEIRVDEKQTSDLIATWTVEFVNDGRDGELALILDDSVTAEITKTTGYMDIKRTTGGEPLSVFDKPIKVLFQNTVTV